MALIGEIRKKKWLLVGSLAAALILFIAMLMFDNPNQSFFGGSRTVIGSVEGNKMEYQEFNRLHDMLYGGQASTSAGHSERFSLWTFFVEEGILQNEAENVGLGVSKAELLELQFSADNNRLSPIVSSRYMNPNTRQLDRQQLDQLKDIITTGKIDDMIKNNQLVPDFKYRWAYQEREIIKDQIHTKIAKMVEKGLYTPNWMAEIINNDQSARMDMLLVQVPYDEIENSEVSLSDEDYAAWFKENKNQFKQDEETRVLEYAVINVVPTAGDSAAIRQRLADLATQFRTTDNDSVFVVSNQGTFDEAYLKKEALSPTIADTIYKMAVGQVYGPYLDGGAYQVAKLLGKKVIPDSVKARHILRKAEDMTTLAAAQKTIDSLKTLVENGTANWDSLAANFSQDASNAKKGGDLGYFGPGMMVKPFNDVCFFKGEPGKIYTAVTQFGVHLIQIMDRKFGASGEASVQVAYLSESIIPTQPTQDAARELALQLQEENADLEALKKSAAAKNFTVETSPGFKINDFSVGSLGASQSSRDMIRWAFGSDPSAKKPKVGQVSPQVYGFQNPNEFHTSKFVVAGLKSVRPKGIPSLDQIKSEIEPQVINYKKAQMLIERMKGKTDLAGLAASFNTKVDTVTNVTFSSAFIQNKGAEPKVVAKAFKLDLNQVSEPLEGATGVFVVMPTNKPAPAPGANLAQIRMTSQQSVRGLVRTRIMQGLRKNADVEDNRSNFF